MSESARQKLVGGWLRILLGIVQMTLAGATVLLWLVDGSKRLVWTLAGAALIAVLISRLLYRSQ